METAEKGAVIVSIHDRKQDKETKRKIRIIGIGIAAFGIFVTLIGLAASDSVSPYASDMEQFVAGVVPSTGIILVLGGIALPIMAGAALKRGEELTMVVYEDHIEGKCNRSGNGQGFNGQGLVVEFHETYDRIGSVSVADGAVIVNMKDGTSLRCGMANANEVAQAIRHRI